MSALNDELIRAVDLALADKWEAAHGVVQQYEEDATAAWIHAVLHKIEGDAGNSRYWYRRADRLEKVDDEARAELAEIRKMLHRHGNLCGEANGRGADAGATAGGAGRPSAGVDAGAGCRHEPDRRFDRSHGEAKEPG